MGRVGAAALFLGLLGIHLACLPGGYSFEDGPELLACAATLGNSHEPGYPLHALAGRLAMCAPVGALSFRVNLVTAACGAGAAVALGGMTAALLRALGLAASAPWAGLFAAALWGLSDAVWWESLIGDKYAPWYLGVIAALAAALAAGMAEGERRIGAIGRAALLAGLAIALHPGGIFVLPLVAWGLLAGGRPRPGPRAWVLAGALLVLPVSVRVIYPPVRSQGGAAMDWGRPRRAELLQPYLTARRYHEAFAGTAPGVSPVRWGARALAGGRFVVEEFPWPLLLGLLPGVAALARGAPGLGAALAAVAGLDIALVLTTPEKVVRWYEPAYLVLVLVAAVGWAAAAARLRRLAVPALALLAVTTVGWQTARGWERNDLASFYAAPDLARNLLHLMPPNAIYLGRGDADLFPLWAARYALGWRPDVEAVGMGTVVDEAPADVAGLDRLGARLGIWPRGWDALRWMLDPAHGARVWFAKTGYDDRLWSELALTLHRAAGIAAQWTGAFDGPGSLESSGRFLRGATLRGVAYGTTGGVFDLTRPRDEVARDALLHYAFSFGALGVQLERFMKPPMTGGAFLSYRIAIRFASPLCGGIQAPAPRPGLPGSTRLALERSALADGYTRLGLLFENRGVSAVARVYRAAADMLEGERSAPRAF